MKKELRLVLIACNLAAGVFLGFSKTGGITAHESGFLQHLRSMFEIYAQDHGGSYPTNWTQVGGIVDLDKINRRYVRVPQSFPIQNYYVFVTNHIPMFQPWKGDVLLIRYAAITNDEGQAMRGIISVGSKGPVYSWMAEQEVQWMLQQTGVELPKPQTVPTPPDEQAALDASAEQMVREIDAQERDARRRPRPRFPGQPQDRTQAESGKTAVAPTGSLAETTPGMSTVPWLALAVMVLASGLLVFLLWRGSRSKTKGP